MNRNSGNVMTIFIVFALVFPLSFALGVYIGKDMGVEKEETVSRLHKEGKEDEADERMGRRSSTTREKEKAKIKKKIEAKRERIADEEPVEEIMDPKEIEDMHHDMSSKPGTTVKEDEATALFEKEEKKPMKQVVVSLKRLGERGKYTVQVGSFEREREALKVQRILKSKGYPAFTKKAAVKDKGIYYRVRVGTFPTRSDAKSYGEVLKNNETAVESFFITVNN